MAEEDVPRLRIVSGGQTGVDRAALDVAAAWGIEIGGWCPARRWAEDGPVPARYPLRETPSARPAERTAWNVRDSDATLVLAAGESRGTDATVAAARRLRRPLCVVHLDGGRAVEAEVREWLRRVRPATLNVAGPRESEAPGAYARARRLLVTVLRPPRRTPAAALPWPPRERGGGADGA